MASLLTQDPLRGVRRLASVAAVATLVLIAMGGAVRATDSGLACPDWPACYGQWIPPADLNMWLEHSHRLWAGVVGIMIAWLAVWTWVRHRDRPLVWGASLVALLLVIVQAGLGAAVVLLHLRAGLVTSHLGMSLVVVGSLILVAVLARRPDTVPVAPELRRRTGRWSAIVAAVVFGQSLLGGQATGRGAAYVFNAFPIWLTGHPWTGHIREWLHVTHRFAGYLVAAAVIVFAVAARRVWRDVPAAPRWARGLPQLAVALVLVQVALGITNVLTQATVASAISHLAVASWLFSAFVLYAALALTTPRSIADPPGPGDPPRDLASPLKEEVST